jgi:LPS sulfotransferase NodH
MSDLIQTDPAFFLELVKQLPVDQLLQEINDRYDETTLVSKSGQISRSTMSLDYQNTPCVESRAEDIRVGRWYMNVHRGNVANLAFPPNNPKMVQILIAKAAMQKRCEIQLNHAQLSVQANRRYAISFRARADGPRCLCFGCARAEIPWDGLGVYEEIWLTAEWQNFEKVFVATADEDNARLLFDLGESNISVELSEVALRSLPERKTVSGHTKTLSNPFGLDRLPGISYIICATPRSGSNLLCEALSTTGMAGKPTEHFISWGRAVHAPEKLKSDVATSRNLTSGAYMRELFDEGTTANGVFGTKTMWRDFEVVIDKLKTLVECQNRPTQEVLDAVFPNLHYIYISRKDKVRQAVSLAKAAQSEEWELRGTKSHAETARKGNLVYDFDEISECHAQILEQEKAWEAYFDEASITPYRVIYETFIDSYEQTILDILTYY